MPKLKIINKTGALMLFLLVIVFIVIHFGVKINFGSRKLFILSPLTHNVLKYTASFYF